MGSITPTRIVEPLAGQVLNGEQLLHARRDWIAATLHKAGREEALRVLVSTNSLACGGAEHQVLRLLPHLNELGLMAEHFYYFGDHFLQPSFEQKRLCSRFLDRDEIGQWRFWCEMVSLMRRQKYDVVHAFEGTANFYVRGAAILAGVPVIMGGWRTRPMDGGLKFRLPYSLLNLRSSAWVINASTNAEALAKLWGMKRLRTYVVPNALDLDAQRDNKAAVLDAELSDWINGRAIVGTVGTISNQKNFDLFLDMAKHVTKQRQDTCFCVIGGAPARWTNLERHLRQRIKKESLSGHVRLLGQSNNVAGFLPHLSVFVLTSDWEGCPNVVIEAMRAQLPVVMTNCTDTSKLIEEGRNGYVVACGDVEAIAQRVTRLLDNPCQREQLGRYSRELCKKHFAAANNAWLLGQIYIEEWKRGQGRRKKVG